MMLIEAAQNADGGWPYESGRSSWTEPSALALLSLWSADLSEDRQTASVKRALAWLKTGQNRDGGWSPQPGTGPSTWVTALMAMLPVEAVGATVHANSVKWLLQQTGQESSTAHRVRQWMLGNQNLSSGAEKGWPWYPGATAWVTPTALSLIALRKIHEKQPSELLRQRIEGGIQYLLVHACRDGGWNHGSTRALGYESSAYPETTGVALLALRGIKAPEVALGIAIAERFFERPNPAGAAWLRLGLLAQSRPTQALLAPGSPRKTSVLEQALHRLNENPDVLLA